MNNGFFIAGTSGWSYKDWVGPFYPEDTPEKKFLEVYAARYNAVEIDSTFYRVPSRSAARSWFDSTPAGFLFFPKMTRSVTHENFTDADVARDEALRFIDAIRPMTGKIGAVVLQFPYFKKAEGVTPEVFADRIFPLLGKLPREHRLAVEVRNKTFLKPGLLEGLRERKVSLVLNDHPWMPKPSEFGRIEGVFTSNLVIVRLLGDRYAIEKITTKWGRTVQDKSAVIAEWAKLIRSAMREGATVAAFANNHFAGYAPETIENLLRLVEE